jgi:hypothetical protein
MSCKVIPRTQITDAMLISSTVAEADYVVWNSGTTYAVGDRVILTTGYHKIYESLLATNLNHHPVTDTSSPPYWGEVGSTNRWAMLDDVGETITTSAGPSMTVVIKPGRFDSIGLLNVDANEVIVSLVSSSGVTYYSATHSMTSRDTPTTSWSDYLFNGFTQKSVLIVTDLPMDAGCTATITFSKASGTVACGMVVMGIAADLGMTQYGARAGIVDFSRIEQNAFGRAVFVERSYAKTMTLSAMLTKSQVDSVSRKLVSLRAKGALYIGAGDLYEALIAYGWPKDWDIGIEYFDGSVCNLTIGGLV